MKKLFTTMIAVGAIAMQLSAQQDPQFTMFYFNKMYYNPAYAGAKDAICGTLIGRTQWTGLSGSPNTWILTADMPIRLPDNNALGIAITTYGDYLGFEKNHGLKAAIAYRRMNLGPGHLAIGIDLAFMNKDLNSSGWITPNGLPSTNDPGIPAALAANSTTFDMNAGIYYHSQKFYAGFSMMHLTGSGFNALNVKQARHMYFTGGYTFNLPGGWQLNPNAIIRTDMATANFDLNLNAIYDFNGRQGIFFGASYRYIDAIGLNVGYNARLTETTGMMIGYNYDINTSRLGGFNSGTHEIIVRFCFKPVVEYYTRYVNRFGDSIGRSRYNYLNQ